MTLTSKGPLDPLRQHTQDSICKWQILHCPPPAISYQGLAKLGKKAKYYLYIKSQSCEPNSVTTTHEGNYATLEVAGLQAKIGASSIHRLGPEKRKIEGGCTLSHGRNLSRSINDQLYMCGKKLVKAGIHHRQDSFKPCLVLSNHVMETVKK